MEKVLEILTRKEVIIAMVVILVIFIIWFIMRKVKIKNCKAQLSELEVRYNSIKSVPLPFKLNKAVAIARVNQWYSTQYDLDPSAKMILNWRRPISSRSHRCWRTRKTWYWSAS